MLIEPLALKTAIAGFNGGVLVKPDLSVIESHTRIRRQVAPVCEMTIMTTVTIY